MNLRSEEELFYQANQIEDRVARDEFLDRACGGDTSLRESLDQLFACAETGDDLLDTPAIRKVESATKRPTHLIQGYEILDRLGEGGFGIVYRALQKEPLTREVALKVLKPGIASSDITRRFESERQLLASMNHPNIASILDAGTTDDGRPFFAMELVNGQPIDEFCDRQQLGIPDRLQLVLDICDAVQYAHQKSIVHRDLKPSNVLVSFVGQAKSPSVDVRRTESIRDSEVAHQMRVQVIDFGIAKVLNSSATSLSVTGPHLLGTPEYMSPEQVTRGADIDTRADVFAIGGILYKLLTGASPLSGRGGSSRTSNNRATATKFDVVDAYRRIVEQEPLSPSNFLRRRAKAERLKENHPTEHPSAVGQDQKQREGRLDAKRLQGDLDWVVMKALQPDPDLRYQSASELAAELRRYSKRQPVLAGPPSFWYRLKKFSSRHRVAAIASVLTVSSLVAGVGLAAIGFVQAQHEKNVAIKAKERAEDERDKAEQLSQALQQLIGTAHTDEGHAKDYSVRELLNDFAEDLDKYFVDQPVLAAKIGQILGKSYQSIGDLPRAELHLKRALELRLQEFGMNHELTAQSRIDYAAYLLSDSKLDQAQQQLQAALAVIDDSLGVESAEPKGGRAGRRFCPGVRASFASSYRIWTPHRSV